MRVLLLCDDHYHPGEVPITGAKLLEKRGHTFHMITDATDFSESKLSEYPVIMMCKCDHTSGEDETPWKTDSIQEAFVHYVESGGGLLVVHSGIIAGKNTKPLDKLIGSRFAFHPNDSMVLVQPLKPHPITEGVMAFCEEDEHYRLEILADDIDIIMASHAPAQGAPSKYESDPYVNSPAHIAMAGYVRTQGKGRVCVLTPGHTKAVWQNPNFQKTLENALRWCAGEI